MREIQGLLKDLATKEQIGGGEGEGDGDVGGGRGQSRRGNF